MTDQTPSFDLFLKLTALRERRDGGAAFERMLDLVRLVFASAKIGFWRYDHVRKRFEWDGGLHEIYGRSPDDFDGSLDAWERMVAPEDRAAARNALENALRSDTPDPVTFRVRRPSQETRWVQAWSVAERAPEDGALVALIGLCRDVTEEKRLEGALVQASRMEVVGTLTAGLASDFNNYLGAALGAAELLAETPRGDERAAEHLAEIRAAVERAVKVTDDLRGFARRAPLAPEPLEIGAVVRDMEAMLRRALPPNVTLESSLAGGLPSAIADRGSLENALLSLVLNARDAMPGGGSLTLETGEIRLGAEAAARLDPPVAPGRYVMLAVSDTGRGMGPEERARVFTPMPTAEDGRAAFGLAMVQGFAVRSGGAVSLRSEPGFGTNIRVFLPTAPEAGAPRLSIARAEAGPRVLVAEDDASMRRVLTAQLAAAGYEVIWAVDGEAALATFDSEPGIALVVADLALSGAVQGIELARRLRERRPALPVVFVTGRPEAASALGLRPEERVLRKPASREALLAAVKAALEAG